MANDALKDYSGLKRTVVDIEPGAISTIDLYNTMPDYFIVNNFGSSVLYCSSTRFPTITKYDFLVNGGKSKLYAEPYRRQELHIYNSGTVAARVTITSFFSEFDPVVLALSNMEFEFSGTISANLSNSLPAGTNMIGSVDLQAGGFGMTELSAIKSAVYDGKPNVALLPTINNSLLAINAALSQNSITVSCDLKGTDFTDVMDSISDLAAKVKTKLSLTGTLKLSKIVITNMSPDTASVLVSCDKYADGNLINATPITISASQNNTIGPIMLITGSPAATSIRVAATFTK